MSGDFAQGTITFTADLPQEAIDKVLANTKEDMDKWLETGNTFDLSDGADRIVVYISFPKGTKLEDVVRVVRCKDCAYWDRGTIRMIAGNPELIGAICDKYHENGISEDVWTAADHFCADGERRTDDETKENNESL